MPEGTQNNTREVKEWYRNHKTAPQIGFDPDGMCLAICRTARNIAPRYPSAISAQINTPQEYRVQSIRKIVDGMVMFFDNPHDDNPFGHIVTVMGRDEEADQDSLSSIFVKTNSVVSDRVVTVRASYFLDHWDDQFQFAAAWLNGEEFYDLNKRPIRPRSLNRLEDSIKSLQVGLREINRALEAQRGGGHDRYMKALKRDRAKLISTLHDLRELLKSGRR